MKLEQRTIGNKVTSEAKLTNMTVSAEAVAHFFDMFINLYSDPVGSVVRELVSNARDAHIEVGVEKPIEVSLYKDGQWFFSVKDYGPGMDENRFDEVYTSFFSSTKRSTNSLIGGFGIGSKTPLAYTDSFYVKTTVDGLQRVYLIAMGEKVPQAFLQETNQVSNPNGTEIIVPVENPQYFVNACREQLFYFEDVVYKDELSHLNEYTIYKAKNFWFREGQSHTHAILGPIKYPIDWTHFDESSPVGVGLKFEVGELDITPSRENLNYSEKTKAAIKAKLEAAKAEVQKVAKKQYANITSIKDYYGAKNNVIISLGGYRLRVNSWCSNLEFSSFKWPHLRGDYRMLVASLFNTKQYGAKIREEFYEGPECYKANPFKRKVKKQSYLAQEHGTFYIVTPKAIQKSDYFGVSLDELAEIQSQLYEELSCKLYDEVKVPETFRKKKKVQRVGIPVNDVSRYGRPIRVMLKDLHSHKGHIVWATYEDEANIGWAYEVYSKLFKHCSHIDNWSGKPYGNGTLFLLVSKINAKHMTPFTHVDQVYWKLLHRRWDQVLKARGAKEVDLPVIPDWVKNFKNVFPNLHNYIENLIFESREIRYLCQKDCEDGLAPKQAPITYSVKLDTALLERFKTEALPYYEAINKSWSGEIRGEIQIKILKTFLNYD